jgi:hypothetical protein
MKTPPDIKTASWGAKAVSNTTSYRSNSNYKFGSSQCSTRRLLPSPHYYYLKIFGNLPSQREWVKVCCCFHPDHNPSLSLNLKSGGFNCFSCGAKGGDVIAFHRKRFALGFNEAIAQLGKIRQGELK